MFSGTFKELRPLSQPRLGNPSFDEVTAQGRRRITGAPRRGTRASIRVPGLASADSPAVAERD